MRVFFGRGDFVYSGCLRCRFQMRFAAGLDSREMLCCLRQCHVVVVPLTSADSASAVCDRPWARVFFVYRRNCARLRSQICVLLLNRIILRQMLYAHLHEYACEHYVKRESDNLHCRFCSVFCETANVIGSKRDASYLTYLAICHRCQLPPHVRRKRVYRTFPQLKFTFLAVAPFVVVCAKFVCADN